MSSVTVDDWKKAVKEELWQAGKRGDSSAAVSLLGHGLALYIELQTELTQSGLNNAKIQDVVAKLRDDLCATQNRLYLLQADLLAQQDRRLEPVPPPKKAWLTIEELRKAVEGAAALSVGDVYAITMAIVAASNAKADRLAGEG